MGSKEKVYIITKAGAKELADRLEAMDFVMEQILAKEEIEQ